MQQDSSSGAPGLIGGSDHAETFLRTDTITGHADRAPLILTGTIEWWHRHINQGRTEAEGMLRLASGERVRFHVLSNVYPVCGHLLAEGNHIVMYARLDLRETRPRAIVRALHEATDRPAPSTPLPTIQAVLAGLDCPAQPRDGDCLTYEPKVRAALTAAGLVAHEATVTGWVDPAQSTIVFLHKATACDGRIVDVTARQFSPALPAVLVESVGQYSVLLARAAGVGSVTVAIEAER